jgi:DNA-binding NtrC family response regulator
MNARSAQILYVNGDLTILRMMTLALESMGHQVLTVSNARMAVDLFRIAPYDYDLVITDTHIEMDAERLVTQMLAARSDIPVVICTDTGELTPEEVRDMGCRACLEKPVKWDRISDTIRRILLQPVPPSVGEERTGTPGQPTQRI